MKSVQARLILGSVIAFSLGGCGTGASTPSEPGQTIPEVARVALACGTEAMSDGFDPVFFGMPTPSTRDTPMELARRFAVRLGDSFDAVMTPHEVTRSGSTVVIRLADPSGSTQGAMQFEQTGDAWELTHLETCPGPVPLRSPQPAPSPQLASSE